MIQRRYHLELQGSELRGGYASQAPCDELDQLSTSTKNGKEIEGGGGGG